MKLKHSDEPSLIADALRTLVIAARYDSGASDFTVPAETICDWLRRYNRWWLSVAGVEAGRNLHLTYGRVLSLMGAKEAPAANLALQVVDTAAGLGFRPHMEMLPSRCSLEDPLDEMLLRKTLCIVIESPSTSDDAEAELYRTTVKRIAAAGLEFMLRGSPGWWLRSGLLDEPDVNARTFQIASFEANEEGGRQARPSGLCVADDGLIYPFAILVDQI